jgi:hypothetical protein
MDLSLCVFFIGGVYLIVYDGKEVSLAAMTDAFLKFARRARAVGTTKPVTRPDMDMLFVVCYQCNTILLSAME